ncbi:Spo0B domain-containing protein [Cohnella sp. AR92]|uniref:Spo0B domain-containing protein n=1 Tax=Cohnella sp. AR92 TaxID=648716 RepID=UPI000F8C3F76|nr:Spo0B domain-containing protein [Cohnella sp. AR92]RUS47663.1 hypothetical protein ELR57_07720 [Cohnella sp. AR92]
MSRRFIARASGIGLSLLLPCLALVFWPDEGWLLALFVLWTIAAAAVIIAMAQRETNRRNEFAVESMRMTTINTVRHHRHDLMNEVQILYGYLKLGKPDKAIDVVERLKKQMEQDSRLSRLAAPKLIAYLLSFRTMCSTMKLEVEVADDFSLDSGGSLERGKFAEAVIGLIDAIRVRSDVSPVGEENRLQLVFYRSENGIELAMNYDGMLAARDSLPFELERVLKGIGQWSEEDREPSSGLSDSRQRMIVAFPLKEQAG